MFASECSYKFLEFSISFFTLQLPIPLFLFMFSLGCVDPSSSNYGHIKFFIYYISNTTWLLLGMYQKEERLLGTRV